MFAVGRPMGRGVPFFELERKWQKLRSALILVFPTLRHPSVRMARGSSPNLSHPLVLRRTSLRLARPTGNGTMTEQEFKTRHPDLRLTCGRSSEDMKWWGDIRSADGRCIALSGRPTLEAVLNDLDAAWRKSCAAPRLSSDSLHLKKKPLLPSNLPQEVRSFGCLESLEEESPQDES